MADNCSDDDRLIIVDKSDKSDNDCQVIENDSVIVEKQKIYSSDPAKGSDSAFGSHLSVKPSNNSAFGSLLSAGRLSIKNSSPPLDKWNILEKIYSLMAKIYPNNIVHVNCLIENIKGDKLCADVEHKLNVWNRCVSSDIVSLRVIGKICMTNFINSAPPPLQPINDEERCAKNVLFATANIVLTKIPKDELLKHTGAEFIRGLEKLTSHN